VGTVTTCPSILITASVSASAITASMIGITIETTVPKVKARITIAARIPISSLDSVAGLETFCPNGPPVSTVSPASFAGEAASMIVCASVLESSPGLTSVVTDR